MYLVPVEETTVTHSLNPMASAQVNTTFTG